MPPYFQLYMAPPPAPIFPTAGVGSPPLSCRGVERKSETGRWLAGSPGNTTSHQQPIFFFWHLRERRGEFFRGGIWFLKAQKEREREREFSGHWLVLGRAPKGFPLRLLSEREPDQELPGGLWKHMDQQNPVSGLGLGSYCGWTKSWTTLKPRGTIVFLVFTRELSIQWLFRWCRISSIYSTSLLSLFKFIQVFIGFHPSQMARSRGRME